MAVFTLQWQSWIVAAKLSSYDKDSYGSQSLYYLLWPFREKCLPTLDSVSHEISFVVLETQSYKMEKRIKEKRSETNKIEVQQIEERKLK